MFYQSFQWIKPILGLMLPVLLCLQQVQAQSDAKRFKVTGRVTDQKGALLPNVSVTEVNTSNGTTTDSTGTYTLYVSGKNASLTFSYVGFKMRRAAVKSNGILDLALEENITENEQVVVVGFGTQKKASVVGAISTIDPKRLQMTPSRSISNNLAGQVSGVLAVQRSGDPTNNNSDFWIRGISTMNSSNRPLVLIDGVERPINDIDPEEIESFSVLKDASASAVYGVRGANGVIMINTKRGKIGSPKVTFRFERAQTSPTQVPEYVGSVKYLEIMNEIYKNSGQPVPYATEDRLNAYRNQTDPDLYPDINWWDVVTRDHADNMRVNATVNGGTNFLRYALELGYFNENGIYERDPKQEWNSLLKVRRYNVRSNVDVNLTPTTQLRFNIGGYLQTRNGSPALNDIDIFYQASMMPPYIHPPIYSSGQIPRVQYRENPWAFSTQRGYVVQTHSRLESLASIDQDLTFIKGLKARLTFAFDRYSGNTVNRTKDPDYYFPAQARDANGNLILNIQSNGQQFLGYNTGSEWGYSSMYLEGQLNYNHVFAGKHSVSGLLLYNQRNYDNGAALPFRNQGIAGRASYTFDRRYIAEFNFGYNGSENFARGQRYGFFPSVAAGWIISEEKFMEGLRRTVSLLKLRGSWGTAGNSEIGGDRRFAYLSTIINSGYYRWGVNADYYRLGRAEGDVGVDGLTWETVTKSNLGIELGLWQGAITLIADVFKDKRKDIFIERKNVPGSAGFSKPIFANFGKVDNHGFDMSLNGRKQINKDWAISVLANFTYAKNKVVEKDEPLAIIGTTRSLTGKPVNQLVGLIAEGLFTDKDFNPDGTLKAGIPSQNYINKVLPGDIRYRDLNGDGKITDLDQTSIGGTTDPQIVYGFGLNVTFKSIDFGFFFQGVGMTDRLLGGQNWIPGSSNAAAGNILTNIDDRWTVDNPRQDVFWPRLSKDLNANNTQASTWWLRDMSFLRLRNIELGYSLPSNWVKHAGMSNFRLFVRGSNLLTISDFKLWDPELGTPDGLKYPIMKSVSAGVTINFL